MRHEAVSQLEDGEAGLIADLYAVLRAFASVVALDEEDPNNLLREALVRTLWGGSLSRLESPMAYLRATIYHLAVSARRHRVAQRRALRRVEVDDGLPEYSWRLEELLQLSPKGRAVLFLRVVEGMPFGEVGRLLGCSKAAARKTSFRARR